MYNMLKKICIHEPNIDAHVRVYIYIYMRLHLRMYNIHLHVYTYMYGIIPKKTIIYKYIIHVYLHTCDRYA